MIETEKIFQTSDVLRLVGIRLIYLNKFVERKLYGIKPYVRSGRGRGSRRIFSSGDVRAIALVWWLFESGLRAKVIQDILKQLSGSNAPSSYEATNSILNSGCDLLVVTRLPRSATRKSRTQKAALVNFAGRANSVRVVRGACTVVIPVHDLFSQLVQRMNPEEGSN